MARIVVALGGNALALPKENVTMASQFQHAREALREIVKLVRDGHEIVITHGNGPQVGAILIRVQEALGKAYSIPLEVAVAETEGEMGYVLEQSLYNALRDAALDTPITSIVTQIVVDENDPGFKHPTKPIGSFYTKEQADVLRKNGFPMIEDAGRGWRRVVASPAPIEIIEAQIIRTLLAQKIIVIAAGGGGIPVIRKHSRLEGVEAVIDKDYASATLAASIGADYLIIVTGVQYAYTDYRKPTEKAIQSVSSEQALALVKKGHFAEGSMLPKIEAALQFVAQGGEKAIITDIPHAYTALQDNSSGTIITK